MQNKIAIQTLVESDPTATPEERLAILEVLNPQPSKPKIIPISTKEAAALLDVHPITLRRYEKAGRVRAIRVSPRRIRWDRCEIERLATGQVA